jgi:thiol-disulfide isomerase/thioredoxin
MRAWNSVLLIALAFVLAPVAFAAENASVDMKLVPSGAMPKLGGYRPQQLQLSADKPESLKKAPQMESPLYGQLRFGGVSYLVALDEPEGKDAKLYVDSNNNGDLTDEAPVTWTKRAYKTPQNDALTQYSGTIQLPLKAGEKSTMVSLGAYRFDKKDTMRAQLSKSIFYYMDYAYDGQITLGEKSYHAMLSDDLATGDFKSGTIRLLIDRNGDGKFDYRSESFDASKPFNIGGTTWAVTDMTPGGSFAIAKSDKTVEEIMPPPDHSVGKIITTFKATTTDGKEVNFPSDYKGKIVMLDFWATWCGPCMAEVPDLVKTYNENRDKGIEILGISLDQPNSAEKVKTVTGEKGMTWPQVYDGQFWQARIAVMYGINSIPAAYLVDGDTGEILAAGNSLRGEELASSFKKALEKKKSSK